MTTPGDMVPAPQGVPLSQEPPTMAADGDKKPGEGLRQEQVPQRLQDALLRMRQRFEGQVDGNRARREYLKKCLKMLEFYRGNQYGWWDFTSNSYRSTTSSTGGQLANNPQQNSQALYVLNFTQGFILALVALLTGNKMTVRFFPRDPSKSEDVIAAEKATLVMRIFQKTEGAFEQLRREAFALCTCGTYVSYIRTVTDGERWGYLDEPELAMKQVQLTKPRFKCDICGDDLNEEPGICGQCHAPLPPQPNVMPQVANLPVPTGRIFEVPRGRTVRDIIDGLEIKLPIEAPQQSEFNMIVRAREVNKSVPRATWPEIADRIASTSGSANELGSSSEYERRVRRQADLGTTTENRAIVSDDRERITLITAWIRPREFYSEDEPSVRAELKQFWPKGVKATWADDVFCEATEEPMDKHLRVCHALPGRSQVREPIIGSIIPVQEIANDILNICRDIIEYTLPATFISTRLLDVRKWARSQSMAGATYNVMDLGRPIAEGFHQTQAGQLPEWATQLLTSLRTDIPQFLTGAFPAAYGAGTPGNNTAEGQEIQRQSALGRVNLFLQAMQDHYAQIAPLVVEDFINNAIEPVTLVEEGSGGDVVLSTVSPSDFKIGRHRAEAEVVSEYPTTWAQRQALLLQMFQMEQFQGWAQLLKNNQFVKRTLGVEMTAPREDAYKLQYRIISKLLREAPQPGPPVPVIGPDGMQMFGPDGQPAMQPGPQVSSVPVFPLDDNPTMLEACTDFYMSSDGQKAMEAATPGWQNFVLHVQGRQMAMAPPPMLGGPPPGGAPALPPPNVSAGPPAEAEAPPN
jgi:hypothetical protein